MEMLAFVGGVAFLLVSLFYFPWRGRGLTFAISVELFAYSAHHQLGPTITTAVMAVTIPVLYAGPWVVSRIARALKRPCDKSSGPLTAEEMAMCLTQAEFPPHL